MAWCAFSHLRQGFYRIGIACGLDLPGLHSERMGIISQGRAQKGEGQEKLAENRQGFVQAHAQKIT